MADHRIGEIKKYVPLPRPPLRAVQRRVTGDGRMCGQEDGTPLQVFAPAVRPLKRPWGLRERHNSLQFRQYMLMRLLQQSSPHGELISR